MQILSAIKAPFGKPILNRCEGIKHLYLHPRVELIGTEGNFAQLR